MRKRLLSFLIATVFVMFLNVAFAARPALDYGDFNNWHMLGQDRSHKVDTLFFYPTATMHTANPDGVIDIDAAHRNTVKQIVQKQASAYMGATNVFVPYYRQFSLDMAAKSPSYKELVAAMKHIQGKQDLFDALDYYFKHYNQGRPFILAGHSQGSMMVREVLADYMSKHPEYLKRMVAAYVLGFGVDEKYLQENKHLKFAQGEADTGVIVSWNIEGPDAKQDSILCSPDPENRCIVINPLNWRRDEQPAAAAENLGALLPSATGAMEWLSQYADARIDLQRGVVVCTTFDQYMRLPLPGKPGEFLFGEKSLHNGDYGLYYYDIVNNVNKRIEAYYNQRDRH